MNTLNSLALAALVGCSDYELNSTKGEDTNVLVDTAIQDTGSEDTGKLTTPTVTLKTALDACLQLDSSGCQWNMSEGAPDSTCVGDAEARKAALEAKIVAEAQAVSGDSTLTLGDIKDGAVPATVYAYYALDESHLNGDPVWANYAYIDIALGNAADAMVARDFPYEAPAVNSLRCMAYSYSYEVDSDSNAVTWTPIETSSHWSEASGDSPEESYMNLIDFRNFGSGSTMVEINNALLDSSNGNFNFITTESALADANEGVLSTAQLYTGVTGEDVKSTVTLY